MSNSTNQDQVITQYLLGSLPEVETERLDELSITSQEFAESLSASEKDLIDAYVQGELSGAMLAQFKSHYLSSPIRRERVEFAEAFQVFARTQRVFDDSPTRGQADLHRKRKRGWLSTLGIFGEQHPALQWGLAVAVVIFIVAGAFLLLQNARLREQMSIEQAHRDELQQREMQLQKELDQQRASNTAIERELAQVREERVRIEEELKKSGKLPVTGTAIASFVLTPQLRGVEQAKAVSIPVNTGRVTMQLNLEPNDYQTFTVVLLDQSNHQELWRSGKLKAGSRGDDRTLNVSFSAGLLKPQRYALQVSGISANGQPEVLSDYPFKVVKY
jgi:predicted nuclease with TOPRIM domain